MQPAHEHELFHARWQDRVNDVIEVPDPADLPRAFRRGELAFKQGA